MTAFSTAKNGHIEAVQTGTGTIRADLVVLGMGNRPNSALAAAAGIPVGPTGGIRTDRQMRTSVDDVWAAGNAVETFHLVSSRPVAIALGTHANKQGRVAGISAAATPPSPACSAPRSPRSAATRSPGPG